MEIIGSTREAQGHDGPIEPAWLSTKQSEIYAGLSRVTLWKLRTSGEIKAARVGRAVRINRRSLDNYLERCSEST